MQNKKTTMFTLLCIVFLDLVGVGIIIPIMPLIFFTTSLLPASTSYTTKTVLMGILISLYPLAQFFGAPLLGTLSDVYGRKKILLLSLFGTLLGYLIFAWGLMASNIYLLFLSRLVDGFTGGNLSIVRSAIADISEDQEKVKNFGLMGMVFGLGFIFGPFIGGKLTDASFISWFTHVTPFWFAALLSAINILLVLVTFKETLQEKIIQKMTLFTGFKHIYKAFQSPSLRAVFLSLFLMSFGWSFFSQFFQLFLFERFQYTASDIGTFFAYMGLCIAAAQGFIIRPISARYSPRSILVVSTFLTSFTLLFLLIPHNHWWLYLIMPLLATVFGFTYPTFSTILSNAVDRQSQGEIMGIQQSILSLSQAIPPLIAGASIALHITAPIILASVCILFAWFILKFWYSEKRVVS